MNNKISILGSGAMGVAIANLVKRNNPDMEVTIWSFDGLPLLPPLSDIKITKDKQEAVENQDYIIFAINTAHLPAFIKDMQISNTAKILTVSKGFVEVDDKLYLSTQYLTKKLNISPDNIAAMGGPNIAKEIHDNNLTTTTIASVNTDLSEEFSQILTNDMFIVNTSDDIICLQLFGALKNAYAFICGYVNEKYGKNAEATAFEIGYNEMREVVVELSSIFEKGCIPNIDDLYFAVLADFEVTCKHGRNGDLGGIVAKGCDVETALSEYKGGRPEGPEIIRKVHDILLKNNFYAPLLIKAYNVIQGNDSQEYALFHIVKETMKQKNGNSK